jgi:hypothetical protein
MSSEIMMRRRGVSKVSAPGKVPHGQYILLVHTSGEKYTIKKITDVGGGREASSNARFACGSTRKNCQRFTGHWRTKEKDDVL